MIKLNENEIGLLKRLAYDITTVEALEKLFLGVCFEAKGDDKNDVYVLAASRLTIDLLLEGFKKLDSYKKVELKTQNNENPAL